MQERAGLRNNAAHLESMYACRSGTSRHTCLSCLQATGQTDRESRRIAVRSEVRTCEQLNIYSDKLTPPDSVTTNEMLELISGLNQRDDIDGILVQLPLPPQVDSKRVLLAVSPEKDVDGFHPLNVGYLSTQRPGLTPCAPAGVIEILKRSNIEISGRDAVVLGRSDIVGKPVAMMLINSNATVM